MHHYPTLDRLANLIKHEYALAQCVWPIVRGELLVVGSHPPTIMEMNHQGVSPTAASVHSG